jgi:hypothetical protein
MRALCGGRRTVLEDLPSPPSSLYRKSSRFSSRAGFDPSRFFGHSFPYDKLLILVLMFPHLEIETARLAITATPDRYPRAIAAVGSDTTHVYGRFQSKIWSYISWSEPNRSGS